MKGEHLAELFPDNNDNENNENRYDRIGDGALLVHSGRPQGFRRICSSEPLDRIEVRMKTLPADHLFQGGGSTVNCQVSSLKLYSKSGEISISNK